jgi:hypothetical protein
MVAPVPLRASVLLAALMPLAALAVALWPATTLLALVVLLVVVLAWRAPLWALAAAVLLFSFEGSVKLLLDLEGTPLPGGARAAGAAALDAALLAAVAGLAVADRLETPRALWRRASTVERVAIGALVAWLGLSVLQIVQGGQPSRGLHGFRLFQAYTALVPAAVIVFARPSLRVPAARVLLAVCGIVSLYAAVRVATGPSAAESDFATSIDRAAYVPFGSSLRATGSFSSAVGLSSFLAPVAVFALVAGFLMPSIRRLGWTVAALALVGLVAAYTRASLFGVAIGVLCALALVLFAADLPRRRKVAAVALAVAALAVTYGAVRVASNGSPALRERAAGILHPTRDKSVQLRFRTWKTRFRSAAHKPLGHGLGAVGAASDSASEETVTADNSFLKILVEQGFLGLALFAGGVIATVAVIARGLRRAAGETRALGLAALAGFVAFVGISLAGEYVEQPGKAIAWVLLGVALAQALGGGDARAAAGEGAA